MNFMVIVCAHAFKIFLFQTILNEANISQAFGSLLNK